VFDPPVLFASALPLSPLWMTSETALLTFEATLLMALRALARAPAFFALRFLAGAFFAAAFFAGAAAFLAGAFFAAFFAGAFFADFLEAAAFFDDALALAGAFFAAFLLVFLAAAFLAGAFLAAAFFDGFAAVFAAGFFGAVFTDFLDFLAAMDSLLFKTVDLGSRTFERKFMLRGNYVARISM
jgi:hypothetical protein